MKVMNHYRVEFHEPRYPYKKDYVTMRAYSMKQAKGYISQKGVIVDKVKRIK